MLSDGSTRLLIKVSFQLDGSIAGRLAMSELKTLLGLISAISSPASVAGSAPVSSRAGATVPSGQRPVLVKAKASRGKDAAKTIQGTYGPTSFVSSEPAGPLSCVGNRLRERLGRIGSTEYGLTWKVKTTPSGRPISRLVPSTRLTSETGCTWLAHSVCSGRRENVGSASRNETTHGRTRWQRCESNGCDVFVGDDESGVVDAASIGRREGWSESEFRSGRPAPSQPDVSGCGVGDTDSTGLAIGQSQRSHDAAQCQTLERTDGRDSETRSFWADAEWLACHDSKKRRTKRGIPLLAAGIPGRVALWRGFGNAINPILAAEVLKSYLDIFPGD